MLERKHNMAKDQALARSIGDFFRRCGLTTQDQLDCFSFVAHRYPGAAVVPAPCQGYCSMTLFVEEETVVQFRPQCYSLDLKITKAAREVYDSFAPETKCLATLPNSGLLVYSMDRIKGVSFRDFRDARCGIAVSHENLVWLCRDFASFLSRAWDKTTRTQVKLGVVGKSIVSRLKSLSVDLPIRFRPTARRVLSQIPQVESLPWVLTHGDITAGNIMIDPSSGHLLGLVDWAEAEHLPFGTSIYGLEEILGEMTASGFKYCRDASDLRTIFWNELKKQIPALHESHVLQAVLLARELGVLLWHGIAFDNGAIDRVVEEGRDSDEIYRLDAFLDLEKQWPADVQSKI